MTPRGGEVFKIMGLETDMNSKFSKSGVLTIKIMVLKRSHVTKVRAYDACNKGVTNHMCM